MKLQQLIEKHWYTRTNLLLYLLFMPFTFIFAIIVKIRFYLYKFHLIKSYKLPVPVVIIGNISVGGVGKTPLTVHIAEELLKYGIRTGVILRGYKGSSKTATIVTQVSDSTIVGDEALIYAKHNIPVAIGQDRYLAGVTLLNQYPDIQLVISDDGLQHYRLQRDYEVVVIDSTRLLGNEKILPQGPLREDVTRLNIVDCIVINGYSSIHDFINKFNITNGSTVISQKLVLKDIYNHTTQEHKSPIDFDNLNTIALAGMGNPSRFFDFIRNNKINLNNTMAFPDHYYYKAEDIPQNYDAIFVTEKDYTKLSYLNNDKIWVVEVEVCLDSNYLIEQIKSLISS